MNRVARWLLRSPFAKPQPRTLRRTRLGMEQLEAREVPASLTTTYSFTGAVGAEVAGFAVPGSPTGSGVLTLDEVPAGATILKATVHSQDWFGTGSPASLTFGGAGVGNGAVETSFGGLSVHSWDVTPLVTGSGAYSATVSGGGYRYGVVLAVAFTAPSLPFGTVAFNTGAVEVAIGHSGPGAASTTVNLATGGAYTLSVFVAADDNNTGNSSGEQVLFNGSAVGGPLDANLGAAASLVSTSVVAVAGTNTVGITTNDDWFGWSLAVLAPTAGVAPPNQPPVATADTLTTRFGTLGSLNVLANDTDPNGDPLAVSSFTQPANGSVAIDSTGLATYTPTAGFYGSDSFTYTVADGKGGTATGSVAVTVNPPPTVAVAVTGTAEGGTPGRVTFTRTGDLTGDILVGFTVGGTAKHVADYTLSAGTLSGGNGTITMPGGSSSVAFDLVAVDDQWAEPTEDVTFTVTSGTGYLPGGSQASANILDNDAVTPTVSLDPPTLSVAEGGTTTLTVRRTGGSESTVLTTTVQLANNPVTAVRAGLGKDFTIANMVGGPVAVANNKFIVAFAAGVSEVTFTVAGLGDNLIEPDEGVRFQLLSGGSSFIIGNKTADLVVTDATPRVSISPATRDLIEGGSGSFIVSRTGSTVGDLPVTVRVEANPALAGRAGWNSDFTLSLADGTPLIVSGGAFSVTIPNGKEAVSFTLKAKSDGVIEATEGVRLRVVAGTTHAASGAATADLTIADATPQVSLSPSTTEVAEGASGTLTLTRTGTTSDSLVVTLRAETSPAFPTRAVWNTDYNLYSLTLPDGTPIRLVNGAFTLTIPAGDESLSFRINGLPDNKTEVTEGVRFRVAGNTIYAAKPNEATADIALLDRTPVVTLSPNSLTVPEGASGSFTVTWTGDSSDTYSDRVVTLQLATNPNAKPSATWNTDYTLLADGQTLTVSGGKFTVTIPSGSNSQTVSIVAKSDARVEGPEGIRVQVATGTVYAAGGSPLDAVVADNPPTVSVTGSTNAAEGGSAGTFTLTRSGGDMSQPLTAWFSLDGTADSTWDYKVVGATYVASRDQYRVTFPANSTGSPTSLVVTLPTINGDCPELDETIELTVVSDSPRYVASASQGQRTLTMTDNDVTPDMVAPGKTWTDGSSVEVFNPGDTWLRASVVGAGWVRLSPVACGETGPAIQNDYFAVVSGLNGFDGDATWVGDVGGLNLTASGDVHDLTLAGTVTFTLPGGGSLNQPTWVVLDAGQGIGNLNAGEVTSLKAAGSIGDVTAKWSVGDIVSIAGSVGNVTAANDIRGGVTASDNIGNVRAGNQISGEISAGGNIVSITVGASNGTAATPLPEAGGLDNPLWVVDEAAGSYVWGSLTSTLPGYGVGSSLVGGLTGEVHADGNIGPVVVFGQISRSVTAGGTLGISSDSGIRSGVWAQGAVGGAVTAGSGDLTVRSWSTVNGAVNAPGAVEVWGYADVTGSVESTGLTATVGSWGDVTGGVSAPGLVDVRAFGSVGQDSLDKSPTGKLIESTEDAVRVWAGDVAAAPVAALTYAAVYGRNKVQSDKTFKATEGDVSVTSADGDVTGADNLLKIEAGRNAEIAAGKNIVAVEVTATKNVTLTADQSVSRSYATAGNNLWAAAKDGDLDGVFVASSGWAYVWAKNDLTGSATAKGVVEATAGRDLNSELTSTDDGVSVTAGRDVLATLTGAYWVDVRANGTVNGEVVAGSPDKWAAAVVQAGVDIVKKVTSSGYASLSAAGSILTDATAADGWLDLTANKAINGVFNAADVITLHAGEDVRSKLTAGGDLKVTAGGSVLAAGGITTTGGDAILTIGGGLTSGVTAQNDIAIQVKGDVTGNPTVASTKGDVSVLGGGLIGGIFRALYVANLRSTDPNADLRDVVVEILGNFSDPNSPWQQRLTAVAARLADLAAAGQTDSDEAKSLKGEEELIRLQHGSTQINENHISADAVRDLLSNPQYALYGRLPAVEYPGPAITLPGAVVNRKYQTAGYVVLTDVFGGNGVVYVLEPFKSEVVDNPYLGDPRGRPADWPPTRVVTESLLGDPDASQKATFYKVVRRTLTLLSADLTPETFLSRKRSLAAAETEVEGLVAAIHGGNLEVEAVALDIGLSILPLVGTANEIAKNGLTWEAGLSFGSDVATVFGVGALFKAQKCVSAATKTAKYSVNVSTVAMTLDGGIGAVRLGQGIYSVGWKGGDGAAGYFGDAFLRLAGLSAVAIKRLRGPFCFVGGTLIHTDDGMRPVEEIPVGSKVWGYDRERQSWGLCVVTGASRTDSVRVVRAVLADGEELSGTPGHPVWVIEGDELELRGRPDEGADEKATGTPGRWVGLVALRAGDVLLTRSGPMRVSRVEEVSDATTVYNLIVGGVHSYAVGAAGVLAHNGGADDCAKAVNATDDVAKQAAKETPAVKPAEPGVPAKSADPVPTVQVNPATLGAIQKHPRIVNQNPLVKAIEAGADPKLVVPDSAIIVRGGQEYVHQTGKTISAQMGSTAAEAASGLPHGSVRVTTAGEIRAAGGTVELIPEAVIPNGPINTWHVDITPGANPVFPTAHTTSPAPKQDRIVLR